MKPMSPAGEVEGRTEQKLVMRHVAEMEAHFWRWSLRAAAVSLSAALQSRYKVDQ